MPFWLTAGSTDDRSVRRKFVPDGPIEVLRPMTFAHSQGNDGRFTEPLNDADLAAFPRLLLVGRPAIGELPHVIGYSTGPWIVSAEVRSIIERLEPRTHRFVNINVRAEEGDANYGDYHLILLTQAIDALVVEHTDFSGGRGKLGRSFSGFGRITLDGNKLSGRHLWRGVAPLEMTYFCSDELAHELRARGLDGWGMTPCLSVFEGVTRTDRA